MARFTVSAAAIGLAAAIPAGLSQAASSEYVPTTPLQWKDPSTKGPRLGTFNIVINAGPGLEDNPAALAAFNRAAERWEARMSDPVTITIDADLSTLGPGVLGSTSAVLLATGYTTVRDQMVTDALDEAVNDAIVAALPTSAQFNALLPASRSLSGNLGVAKANAKALGFTGLDASFGASDGEIEFSQDFDFDFDNSDGVNSNEIDFETVAAHEIGHLLGFVSVVDNLDAGSTAAVTPFTLDLFRFANGVAGSDPSNAAEFTTNARSLRPNTEEIFDDTMFEYLMSTGFFTGDGRQASHWKDGDLTGTLIGVLDPTLGEGELFLNSEADYRAFDLIGYDLVSVPEPGALGVLAVAGLWALRRGRRRPA